MRRSQRVLTMRRIATAVSTTNTTSVGSSSLSSSSSSASCCGLRGIAFSMLVESKRHLTREHQKPLVIKQGYEEYRWERDGNGAHSIVAIQQRSDPWTRFKKKASSIIYPTGYPRTVAPGYMTFFRWTCVGQASGAFSVTVATQALLSSFFSGQSPAMWLLKDLFPTFLTALFANVVFAYERRAKEWFVVAAALGQLGVLCELMIPTLVPASSVVFAACFTSFMKGSAVMMLGITRTTMLQHYAIAGNIGELSKKVTTVIMLMYPLMGALGIGFASICPYWHIQVATVLTCSAITVGSALMAVRNTNFTILTQDNAFVLAERYFKATVAPIPGGVTPSLPSSSVPSPQEFGYDHGLFTMPSSPLRPYVCINPKVSSLHLSDNRSKMRGYSGYVIGVCPIVQRKEGFITKILRSSGLAASSSVTVQKRHSSSDLVNDDRRIVILTARNAKFRDVLCAVLRCVDLLQRYEGGQVNWDELGEIIVQGESYEEEQRHLRRVDAMIEALHGKGWNTVIQHIDNVATRVKFLKEDDQATIVSMRGERYPASSVMQEQEEAAKEAEELKQAAEEEQEIEEEKERQAELRKR